MESISMHNEQTKSKRRNLALTTTIASLFFMPNDGLAQKKITNDIPHINYIEQNENPYLLFNPRDINTEYPNREFFLKNLMDSFKSEIPNQIEGNIDTKPQVVPLSFAKKSVQKYFPERSNCFKEIISGIQKNHQLYQKLNVVLNQTIMKPTIVHKETNRRPSTERDKVCAILIFLEGIMKENKFANYIDQKDKLAILSCEPNNRQVSDTLKYETRLALSDQWIMPGEMMQRVLDADQLFQSWLSQQKSGQDIVLR